MWPFPEIRSVGDIPRYNARKAPQKKALLFEDNVLSNAQLDQLTNQFAQGLIQSGVKAGDRVAFYGSNSDDFLIALLGAAKAGVCFVPLNWRLAVKELTTIVKDAELSFALVNSDLEDTWSLLEKEMGEEIDKQLICPGDPDQNPFRHWLGEQADNDPGIQCRLDDIAWILYTSGTTGVPKGVELTHGSMVMMRMCEHFEPAYTWSADDNLMFVAPNFHLLGIGLTIQAMFNGGTISVVKGFEPVLVLQEITAKRPTILALAPVMIQMMLAQPEMSDTDFSSIREVVYAGSAISLGVIKRALEVMPCRFMQFYGATESGGAITLLRPEEHDLSDEKRLTSCGKPLPLIDVKIVNSSGVELADGEAGEMWVRDPGLATGYRGRPEEWAKVYENGWYKTGDVAYRDEQGFLYIVDRVKDMIITGGENVYCAEIENCLSLHPAIEKSAIIGVPSEKWGEEVKACIVLKAGKEATADEIIAYAREHLAGYKCPKSVNFYDELPLGGTGKVLKRQLRAPFWKK